MINITEATKVAVQEMVTESFKCNAKVDRMKSVLATKFAYSQTANLIHLGIAHKFPIELGDSLGDLLEGHNISIVYGGIQVESRDYSSVSEILNDLLSMVYEYQNELNMCAKISIDNMDLHVYQGVLSLTGYFNKIVEQCILLVDKINLYGESPTFDADIEKFWILD